MKLRFGTLFSGSSGNAVYLSYGDDALLFDAGRSARYIKNALLSIGEDPAKIRAVFITHEHDDHISALPVLSSKLACPVYVPLGCFDGMMNVPDSARFYEGTPSFTVGPFTVESFFTPHDSCGSVGYIVRVAGKKIGVATDMGMLAKSVAEALAGCDAALVECNYDEEMLRTGPYAPSLKRRVGGQRGHLSNADGATLCAYLAYTGARDLLLGHLSKENNTPDKALAAVRAEFEKRGVCAHLAVASREQPTMLIEEELP